MYINFVLNDIARYRSSGESMENLMGNLLRLLCGRKFENCRHLLQPMYCAVSEKGRDKEAARWRKICMILLYLCAVTAAR